ncbi:cell separation during budding [Knufia fluminis]|uniref:Cell separation during budding n=1 Tax=Knufia fluminis TaxID=191047 RepID=A0AAN8F6M3_9EURO|nr:cell separation during budding [Knufia fluminis]
MATPGHDPSSSGSSAPQTPQLSSPRSSIDASKSPRLGASNLHIQNPSSAAQHRQSFGDLRYPPSPRSTRQSSVSSIAIQDLIDNPPHRTAPDARFAHRDWRTIRVAELSSPEDLKFIDINANVEEATNLLIDSGAPVLLLRDSQSTAPVVGTFDYNALNAYLLTAVGIAQPSEENAEKFAKMAQSAGAGKPIPLRDVRDIGRKDPVTFLPESANLTKAIETFGRGVHRVLIAREGVEGNIEVTGLLSQTRLMRFLWDNGRNFPLIEQLYSQYLRDLKIGSNSPISIK